MTVDVDDSEGDNQRCPTGERCSLARSVFNPAGQRTGVFPGALAHPDAGLCPGCTGRLLHTLGDLPELVARLHVEHLPNLAVRYRTVEFTDGEEKLPIPLNEHADALIRLLDHELRTWADTVADTAGLVEAGEWHPDLWDRMRLGARITQACQLLHHRHAQWLSHGPVEYRARSLGAHRADGHDEDAVTFNGRDLWVTRSGAQAAAHLLSLARRARAMTVPDGTDWLPVPCRRCQTRKLHRHHMRGLVVCHGCGHPSTDDQHDAFLAAALGDPPPAREAPDPAGEWVREPCPKCSLRRVYRMPDATLVCRSCDTDLRPAAFTGGRLEVVVGDAAC